MREYTRHVHVLHVAVYATINSCYNIPISFNEYNQENHTVKIKVDKILKIIKQSAEWTLQQFLVYKNKSSSIYANTKLKKSWNICKFSSHVEIYSITRKLNTSTNKNKHKINLVKPWIVITVE